MRAVQSAMVLGGLAVAVWLGSYGCSDSPSSPADRGGISGAVRNGNAGVAGATLTLSGGASRTATSATNGSFSFSDLAAGSYSVAVSAPAGFTLANGEAGSKSVSVAAGQTATVNFALVASNGGGGNVVTVSVSGFTFSPSTVTVARGTTVKWENGTANLHTVTPDGHSEWNDATLQPNAGSFQHTFNTAGSYAYYCTPHRAFGMTGVVNVQ